MTRLTNEMRDRIVAQAIANLPAQNHHAEARKIIEKTIWWQAPPPVQTLLKDDRLRRALACTQLYVMMGNRYVFNYLDADGFLGICDDRAGGRYPVKVYMDQEAANRGVFSSIHAALHADGVVQRCIEQRDLLENVKRRLKSAVYSVNTLKRLHDVLEPELHHLIPKAEVSPLPVASFRVADDLKKLGAELPA
jgi:hypothetical protein